MTTHSRREPADRPGAAVGQRFAGLEGYRGLAAVAIVLYHVFQSVDQHNVDAFTNDRSPGYLLLHGLDGFVALFFVLSAFLLSLPYARSALTGKVAPSPRAFLLRRASRIVPLYLVAVILVWAARNPRIPGDWRDLVEHLTFTQVYDDKRIFYTIGPAWSLAVEIQFYLFLALAGSIAVVVCRRFASHQRFTVLVAITVMLALVSLGYKWWAAYVQGKPQTEWHVWFGLPAKLDEFAFGILLAIIAARGGWSMGAARAWTVRLLGLGIVAAALVLRPHDPTEHAWFHTVAALGFVLVLASSVLGPEDRWTRIMRAPIFGFVGLISYGLYLWHEPVLLFLQNTLWFPSAQSPWAIPMGFVLLLTVSMALAWATYLLIEKPAGKLRTLIDASGKSRDYYDGS